MNARRNVYVVAIYNENPSLSSSDVQILWDKQKRARSSSVVISLFRRYPSALPSLDKHRAFFDQVIPLLEPNIRHHGVFSAITP